MLVEQEVSIRLAVFCSGLLGFWLLGLLIPYRKVSIAKRRRAWACNLSTLVFNTVALRIFVPISLIALAAWCTENHVGVLSIAALPTLAGVLLSVVLLDLGIYWQHRLMHRVPLLWRLHRLHHSDMEFDVTTATRFHLIEIFVSLIFKVGLIALIGPPVVAVILFELLLNFSAMFNHANISLSSKIEQPVRLVLVTPDMHRIHHSSRQIETDSNYGFCLSIWDRCFRSYRAEAIDNPRTMEIGLKEFREPRQQSFTAMLLQPFK